MKQVVGRPLAECGRLLTGGTPSRSNPQFWNGLLPWISAKSLKDFDIRDSEDRLSVLGQAEAAVVPAGSVLFVVRGMSLAREFRVGVATRPVAFNQDLRALVPNSSADGRYIARFLQATAPQTLAMVDEASHGTKRLTSDRFENLEVPLPPLSEQRRIAEILDKADALRAKRRAALALLDTLTQSIFLEMFGDPATNPRGWPLVTVGDLLESATYGTSAKASSTGKLPVLRMNNITSTGMMDLSDLKFMDLPSAELGRYTVQPGDVLFNRTNSPVLVGKTAIYRDGRTMAYAGYLIRLRLNEGNDPEYLAAFMNTAYTKRVLRSMCKSIIGMANINATELRSIKIAQPPLALQQRFALAVEQTVVQRSRAEESRAHLDALFASLQHRAFRGEL